MSKIIFNLPPLPYYLTIGETNYERGEQHPKRRNIGVFDLLIVTKGSLSIGENNKNWEVKAGQSLLLLPDRYHYSTKPCETATHFYWIHFDYQDPYHVSAYDDYSLPIRHAWNNPYKLRLSQYTKLRQFSRIKRILIELIGSRDESDSMFYWQAQQHFLELLRCLEYEAAAIPASKPVLQLAERTEAYLRHHFQRNLTNETLARELNYHPNYIVRCMKEVYHCTPMEYLLQYRVEQAKLLLIKTELSVGEISEQVGFNYTPYFSKCFKRHTGLSPLSFRKLYAGEVN